MVPRSGVHPSRKRVSRRLRISPYSSGGPGSASGPGGRRRSNGSSPECSDTPLHTHLSHTHPRLRSGGAVWGGWGGRQRRWLSSYRKSQGNRQWTQTLKRLKTTKTVSFRKTNLM